MSRDDHTVQLIELSYGEDKTLLQFSPSCPTGERWCVSISSRQRSPQCGQNFRGSSWELHCRWQLDRALEQWWSREGKSAQNSIDRAMASKTKTEHITALTTVPQRWVSTHKHQYTTVIVTDVDRILVGLSWELHCQWELDHVLERWRTTGRQKG